METGGCFINWSFRKEGKVWKVHVWSVYYLLGTVRAGYPSPQGADRGSRSMPDVAE